MYLTVLCLSYTLGTSPFFPPKSFYCLDHWTTKKNKKNKNKKKEEKKKGNIRNPRKSAHKECWVSFMMIKDLPPIIYSK